MLCPQIFYVESEETRDVGDVIRRYADVDIKGDENSHLLPVRQNKFLCLFYQVSDGMCDHPGLYQMNRLRHSWQEDDFARYLLWPYLLLFVIFRLSPSSSSPVPSLSPSIVYHF